MDSVVVCAAHVVGALEANHLAVLAGEAFAAVGANLRVMGDRGLRQRDGIRFSIL